MPATAQYYFFFNVVADVLLMNSLPLGENSFACIDVASTKHHFL